MIKINNDIIYPSFLQKMEFKKQMSYRVEKQSNPPSLKL